MTSQRKLELFALALVIAYAVAYFVGREPVCEIGSVGRASVSCRPLPPAPKQEKRPGGGFLVLLGGPSGKA